jgi:hypothetical protein
LLYKTNEMRLKTSRISNIKNKIRATHAALGENGPSPLLTAKIKVLNEKLAQSRANFSHTAHTAKEELLTQEFFSSFKSCTNNGDMAELFTTDTWDTPTHNPANTTDKDASILEELRKYYAWLYSEKPSINNEAPLKALRDRPLQQSDIELMERPFTLHECRQAMHRLGTAKAAGPDGLFAEFYKSFEELVVRDFHKTILEAHASGALPPTMREGDVVLLYK